MSAKTNTLKPLDLVNIVDPRLKCLEFSQEKLEYGVVKGASYSNYQQQKANSYSQSGVSFNWNTQGANTMIDRRMYVKCQFQVSLTGTPANGTYLFNSGLCAPRSFPLGRITENATITINGTSISCAYSDVLDAILRYNCDGELEKYDLSGTPTMLDNFQNYTLGVGSVRNPLNNYANSGDKTGRGSFVFDVLNNPVGDGNPKTAVVKFTVVEPLILSPMSYSSQHLEHALIGVNNMAVQLNFSNLQRIWSQALQGTENITNISIGIGAGITEQPELLINYLNTPLVDEASIPKEVVYDYYNIETYQNDQNVNIPAGGSQTFTNNSIQLSVVPRSIWIYCAVPRGSKTYTDADAYFRINSISLQYLNVSGQLSSATRNDLYNLSVKNGCKMSYQEWSGASADYNTGIIPMVGSVLRLDVSDLALPSNLASGCSANSQLQFTINVTNQASQAREISIYTIIANEGLMTITNNTMLTQTAILSQDDVLNARINGEYRDEYLQNTLYGGSFFSKMKHLGKALSKFMKKHKLDKELENVARDVVKSAIKSRTGGAVVGSGLVGGRKMTRSELRELME
jgi:hypothetical protein